MDLKTAVLLLDSRLSKLFGRTGEEGHLLSFVFHSLFRQEDDSDGALVDRQQNISVQFFAEFISYFHSEGYQFVSPDQVLRGLSASGKYVFVTFDDGYFNNSRALPVLERFEVPATFFISSGHIKQSRAFWWDVVYRELHQQGFSDGRIQGAIATFKSLKTLEIEQQLRKQYGEEALHPKSDLDRPFREDELAQFARHPLVHLGNHTRDHAILTRYSRTEIHEQIRKSQNEIREITGKTPICIAYPNGDYSDEVIMIAQEAGLQLGVTTVPGRTAIPLNEGTQAMKIKRFMLWGSNGMESQCNAVRSRLSLYRTLQTLKRMGAHISLQSQGA